MVLIFFPDKDIFWHGIDVTSVSIKEVHYIEIKNDSLIHIFVIKSQTSFSPLFVCMVILEGTRHFLVL